MDEIYFNQIFCASFITKQRNFTKLNVEKKIKDGFVESTEKFIANLPRYELSSKVAEILMLGLRNGVATRPVKSEMIVILEDI